MNEAELGRWVAPTGPLAVDRNASVALNRGAHEPLLLVKRAELTADILREARQMRTAKQAVDPQPRAVAIGVGLHALAALATLYPEDARRR